MLSFENWRHRREMKRRAKAYEASLSPTVTGPLTDGERRIVELLTAGDDSRLTAVRAAFLGASDVRRAASPNQFSIAIWAVVPEVPRGSRSGFYVKDLVITDSRFDAPLPLNLYQSSSNNWNEEIGLTTLAERPTGSTAAWPMSLQADEWWYLDAAGGQHPARVVDPATFVETRTTKPGRPAAWLKELLDQAGDAVVPVGAADADDLAVLEEACGTTLPREVKQFYRWSDGAQWGEREVFSTQEAFRLDLDPARTLLVVHTDISGNPYALDLDRANATTCPVVYFDPEETEVAPTFRAWLADAL